MGAIAGINRQTDSQTNRHTDREPAIQIDQCILSRACDVSLTVSLVKIANMPRKKCNKKCTSLHCVDLLLSTRSLTLRMILHQGLAARLVVKEHAVLQIPGMQ